MIMLSSVKHPSWLVILKEYMAILVVWKCKAKLDTESREHGLGSVRE